MQDVEFRKIINKKTGVKNRFFCKQFNAFLFNNFMYLFSILSVKVDGIDPISEIF